MLSWKTLPESFPQLNKTTVLPIIIILTVPHGACVEEDYRFALFLNDDSKPGHPCDFAAAMACMKLQAAFDGLSTDVGPVMTFAHINWKVRRNIVDMNRSASTSPLTLYRYALTRFLASIENFSSELLARTVVLDVHSYPGVNTIDKYYKKNKEAQNDMLFYLIDKYVGSEPKTSPLAKYIAASIPNTLIGIYHSGQKMSRENVNDILNETMKVLKDTVLIEFNEYKMRDPNMFNSVIKAIAAAVIKYKTN
jgi:hypothetical protein